MQLPKILTSCQYSWQLGWLDWCSDSLWTELSGDQSPVRASFSLALCLAFYSMDTRSFPELKQPGRVADHPHPSSTKDVNGFDLYLCSLLCQHAHVMGRPLPLCTVGIMASSNSFISLVASRYVVFKMWNTNVAMCYTGHR